MGLVPTCDARSCSKKNQSTPRPSELFLKFSVYVFVANPKKLLDKVANPARGLLNREKKEEEKRRRKKKSLAAHPPSQRVVFPFILGVRLVDVPAGSHRRKVKHDFSFTFLLRCLP